MTRKLISDSCPFCQVTVPNLQRYESDLESLNDIVISVTDTVKIRMERLKDADLELKTDHLILKEVDLLWSTLRTISALKKYERFLCRKCFGFSGHEVGSLEKIIVNIDKTILAVQKYSGNLPKGSEHRDLKEQYCSLYIGLLLFSKKKIQILIPLAYDSLAKISVDEISEKFGKSKLTVFHEFDRKPEVQKQFEVFEEVRKIPRNLSEFHAQLPLDEDLDHVAAKRETSAYYDILKIDGRSKMAGVCRYGFFWRLDDLFSGFYDSWRDCKSEYDQAKAGKVRKN